MTSESLRVIYVCSGILRSLTNVWKKKREERETEIIFTVIYQAQLLTQVTGSLIPCSNLVLVMVKVICNWICTNGK